MDPYRTQRKNWSVIYHWEKTDSDQKWIIIRPLGKIDPDSIEGKKADPEPAQGKNSNTECPNDNSIFIFNFVRL